MIISGEQELTEIHKTIMDIDANIDLLKLNLNQIKN